MDHQRSFRDFRQSRDRLDGEIPPNTMQLQALLDQSFKQAYGECVFLSSWD